MTEKAEFRISNEELRMKKPRHRPSFFIRNSKFFIPIFALALNVTAQTAPSPNPYAPNAPIPLGDVLLSLPTSHIPSTGTWEIKFTHRFNHAFNVPVGIALLIKPALSVVGEVIPKNRDLPNTIRADFGWALGLKRAVGGHYFEILLTNNNATHVDQYVTSTYQGSGLNRSDLHLGFNIERRFGK